MHSRHKSAAQSSLRSITTGSATWAAAAAFALFLAGCGDSGNRQVSSAGDTPSSEQQSASKPTQETASDRETTAVYQSEAEERQAAASQQAATGQQASPSAQPSPGTVADARQPDASAAGKQVMRDAATGMGELEAQAREVIRTTAGVGLTDQQVQQIQIAESDGTVTLTGQVPTRDIAKRIEERIQQMPGVNSVQNQLVPQQE